jgi:WD repeat-containing protein 35
MFCCLFKKVTVHNTAKLNKISCNRSSNFIAIGGSEGFVKVVQIDLTKQRGEQSNNPLTFTQNLICHKKKITVLAWNSGFEKLTTADEDGVIIVWKFSERNQWEQEMINNREISFVTDIKWDKQGNFICFIYDDGHSIVGSVEGNRCWGIEIKERLYLLEWSPDSSYLLFASKNNNIIVFSSSGYQIGEMELDPSFKALQLATLSWWTNPISENNSGTLEKHLMLAYTNGTILLYDDYQDTKPFKIATEFNEIKSAEWNPSGDIIAVSGVTYAGEERKDAISFYSLKGTLMKSLKIPNVITSFCWDGCGTKLAISTDSLILFSLIKPKYKWTYFSDTLVYSFMTEPE